jgi:hypothetical protein
VKKEVNKLNKRRLFLIKLIHTLVWSVYAFIIFYLFIAAVTNNINFWVWFGVGMVMIEGMILLAYRWTCPMTLMARKYSDSGKHNFDIFLPEWVARYNKNIFMAIFFLSMVILVFRVI